MIYKGPDNIYWLFSSSAQAIAAFIGFVTAGFFFFHDRVSKEVAHDETLEEIYSEIRRDDYVKLKFLLVLTGTAIIISLLAVFLNGYDLGQCNHILHIIAGAANLITIGAAIYFVIYVVNPNRIKQTTATLIKQDRKTFEPESGQLVSSENFISKFIQLENLMRKIANQNQLEDNGQFPDGRFMPLSEIIKRMNLRELITRDQTERLRYLSKVRNLAVHGDPRKIDEGVQRELERITQELRDIN